MLILSRREAECIYLGEDIVLTIVSVGNDKVRIGVKAPQGVRILRNELEVTEPTIPLSAPSGSLQRPVAGESSDHAEEPAFKAEAKQDVRHAPESDRAIRRPLAGFSSDRNRCGLAKERRAA